MCGVVSADLGRQHALKGNQRAMGTVVGIIDGTGSLGAAAVQYLVGALSQCKKVDYGTPITPGGKLCSEHKGCKHCHWDKVSGLQVQPVHTVFQIHTFPDLL
jgi:hypothetical protein